MSALELDLMLSAALPHAEPSDEDLPALCALHLSVTDGLLQVAATDRYTLVRERRPVNQTCESFRFLLRRSDVVALRALLKGLLAGLDKDERPQEPVDLFVDLHDGRTLCVLGAELDVRFAEVEQGDRGDFPDVDGMVRRAFDRLENVGVDVCDLSVNPTLLARLVPLQKAGRQDKRFRFRWCGPDSPVMVTTVTMEDEVEDDVVVLVSPVKLLTAREAAAL